MKFDDYEALARYSLAHDNERVIQCLKAACANEEAAGRKMNAERLAHLAGRYGGVPVDPNLPMIRRIPPRFSFSDLVFPKGHLEAANDIRLEREKREELEKHGLEPRSRILCHGNPGTGKTAYAHALAAFLELPLYEAAWSQVIDQYLGSTSRLADKMLDWICGIDCVFLLDEVDIILRERDDKYEIGEMKRIVCNLLPKLESMGSRAVIVATTNHPQCLDMAVWRRFQENLFFPDMRENDKRAAFKKFCEKHEIRLADIRNTEVFFGIPCENFAGFMAALESALRKSLTKNISFEQAMALEAKARHA